MSCARACVVLVTALWHGLAASQHSHDSRLAHHHPPGDGERWVDGLYHALGLSAIPSPWLQVVALLAALAIYSSAVGGLALWVSGKTRSPILRQLVGAALALLVAGGGLVVAVLFGTVGQQTGMGRDPWFLASWVALLFLSLVPLGFMLRRGERRK